MSDLCTTMIIQCRPVRSVWVTVCGVGQVTLLEAKGSRTPTLGLALNSLL